LKITQKLTAEKWAFLQTVKEVSYFSGIPYLVTDAIIMGIFGFKKRYNYRETSTGGLAAQYSHRKHP
jgi:hypothetical protein